MTIPIYERDGATRIRLAATHEPGGALTVSGYDAGLAPLAAYGHDELDYELTIPAEAVPAAVAALLRALLAPSETPVTTLRQILDAAGVGHTFRTLP